MFWSISETTYHLGDMVRKLNVLGDLHSCSMCPQFSENHLQIILKFHDMSLVYLHVPGNHLPIEVLVIHYRTGFILYIATWET